MPIVAMEPVEQLGRSLIRVLIGASVGPFAKRGLNEALSFSIGLRSVWPGEDLTKAEAFTGCPERLFGKIGNSSFQEGDSTIFALVGPDLDEGDPRGIVDADVDELPTNAKVTIHRAGISSSDAVPHRTDATELLNIEVDELARILALIASDRFGRLQGI